MPTVKEEKRAAMEKHMSAARVHMEEAANYQQGIVLLVVGTHDYGAERSLSTKLTNLSIQINSALAGIRME
jgi:hypothetical protein